MKVKTKLFCKCGLRFVNERLKLVLITLGKKAKNAKKSPPPKKKRKCQKSLADSEAKTSSPTQFLRPHVQNRFVSTVIFVFYSKIQNVQKHISFQDFSGKPKLLKMFFHHKMFSLSNFLLDLGVCFVNTMILIIFILFF